MCSLYVRLPEYCSPPPSPPGPLSISIRSTHTVICYVLQSIFTCICNKKLWVVGGLLAVSEYRLEGDVHKIQVGSDWDLQDVYGRGNQSFVLLLVEMIFCTDILYCSVYTFAMSWLDCLKLYYAAVWKAIKHRMSLLLGKMQNTTLHNQPVTFSSATRHKNGLPD